MELLIGLVSNRDDDASLSLEWNEGSGYQKTYKRRRFQLSKIRLTLNRTQNQCLPYRFHSLALVHRWRTYSCNSFKNQGVTGGEQAFGGPLSEVLSTAQLVQALTSHKINV